MAGLWLEAVVPGWSGRYLHTQFGLRQAGYNTGNLAFYVALALAQVLASILLAPHLRYLAVLAGGLLFAGGMTLAVTAQSVPLVVVGLAACGAGAANVQPLAASVAADVFGTDGGVVSRLQTPAYIGPAAGNAATGFLAGAYGLRKALATSVLVALLVCVLSFSLKTDKPSGAGSTTTDESTRRTS